MKNSRLSLTTFGTILGIAGIEHGIGEILQGEVKPGSMFFESWPDNELYEILAGEPAFTVLKNLPLSITGTFAIVFSVALIFCSLFLLHRRYGGLLFLILTVCQFLFGAGVAGPILMGVIISIAAPKMRRAGEQHGKPQSGRRLLLSRIFILLFSVSVVSWLSMWPGLVIIGTFADTASWSGAVVYLLSGISFVTFVLSIVFGLLSDNSREKTVCEN